MAEIKYKRVLLKLSGEALSGEKGFGFDPETAKAVAEELKEVHDLGAELAIVCGGGNVWRGVTGEKAGMERAQADYTWECLQQFKMDCSFKVLLKILGLTHE